MSKIGNQVNEILKQQKTDAKDSAEVAVVPLPSLAELYPETPNEALEDGSAAEVKRPELSSHAFFMHSSGSTGLPKVIKVRAALSASSVES